jgi:hypothetical protein
MNKESDKLVRFAVASNVAAPTTTIEDTQLYKDPANDQEALEGAESKQWWEGLVKECDGFHEIKTWKLVKCKDAKLDNGNKPLTTKNVYKKKLHAPVTKEPCYRVRNCIRSLDMISGIHYDASFAPMPTNTTVKVVFAIALYYLQQLGARATMEHLTEPKRWNGLLEICLMSSTHS